MKEKIKYILGFLIPLFLILPSAQATDMTQTPPSAQNLPITITAFQGNTQLDYVEIKNQTSQPFYLGTWKLQYTISTQAEPLETLLDEGWILSGNSLFIELPEINNISSSVKLTHIRLVNSGIVQQEVVVEASYLNKSVAHKKRSNASIGTTGVFTTDYEVKSVALISDDLYFPLESANGLEVVEILPNSKNCSVAEQDISCGDYIKVQNKSNQTIDLANYRVRYGYQGQSATKANTFNWHSEFTDPGILNPGEYFTIYLQNDNQTKISLPDESRFVWLEDAIGVQNYADEPNANVQYPDATKVVNKGQSWAFDENDSQWKWAMPSPDAENTFLAIEEKAGKGSGSELKPCRSDQFRNPATNRCKLISSTTSTLKPCASNQYRNPETNRCRLISAASSALKPCNPDQFRNPETNRCKKIGSSTSSLKPCKPNQKRNPETNRCRKVVENTAIAGAVDEVPQDDASPVKNMTPWLVGLAGGGVVLYGIYEWRTEIMEATLRLRDIFGKGGGPPSV